MSFWYNYRSNSFVDDDRFKELLCKIGINFNSFHLAKFIQAYRFIRCNTRIQDLNDFFFDVLAEYNLIKNIDNDIEELKKFDNITL